MLGLAIQLITALTGSVLGQAGKLLIKRRKKRQATAFILESMEMTEAEISKARTVSHT